MRIRAAVIAGVLLFGLSALPTVAGAQTSGQAPSTSSPDDGSQPHHKGKGGKHRGAKGKGKRHGGRHGGKRAACADGAQPDASTGCSGQSSVPR